MFKLVVPLFEKDALSLLSPSAPESGVKVPVTGLPGILNGLPLFASPLWAESCLCCCCCSPGPDLCKGEWDTVEAFIWLPCVPWWFLVQLGVSYSGGWLAICCCRLLLYCCGTLDSWLLLCMACCICAHSSCEDIKKHWNRVDWPHWGCKQLLSFKVKQLRRY